MKPALLFAGDSGRREYYPCIDGGCRSRRRGRRRRPLVIRRRRSLTMFD